MTGPGVGVNVRFHTCPVCRREITQTSGVTPTFRRHSDTASNWCPMSGRPIPVRDGGE